VHDLRAGRRLPPRAVAVTFDDGYRDNLDVAVPLLQQLGIPATFFLVPGLLSREVRPWWEDLAWGFQVSRHATVTWEGRSIAAGGVAGWHAFRLIAAELKALDRATRERKVAELLLLLRPTGKPPEDHMFLDWAGAQELTRRGFAVGSHSMWHSILSRESPERQVDDLARCRRELETKLDVPVDLLAYPNGRRIDHNASTARAAAATGHAHGFGTYPGLNGPRTPAYDHPRCVLQPDRTFLEILVRRFVLRRPAWSEPSSPGDAAGARPGTPVP
jgi:peptidoglycan/xylan/chitin deacetylase (PgdA/CDA1 family)